MKRYTSCLVVAAAWICTGARADENNDYVPPAPLREAVTARSSATDINDTSLAGAQEKPPAEAADSLRQGASTHMESHEDSNWSKSRAEAGAPPSGDARMSEITGSPDASGDATSEAASSVAPAAEKTEENAQEAKASGMMQTKKRLVTDPIAEMMGGQFNTEMMAESFLSVRPRVMRLKANRDF